MRCVTKEPLTIGIVGGMSPESTLTYYQAIVRRHQAEFHNHNYPRIVIVSVSFQQYIEWQHTGAWELIAKSLAGEFRALAAAGADFAILATNTMHKVLPQIKSPIRILSIFDVVSRHAKAKGIQCVGLTGTRFTMSDGFYAQELEARGLSVVLPTALEQETIHRAIYDELIKGEVASSSAARFAEIAHGLLTKADAVLLGCTELELLTRGSALQPNFIDSTRIHAEAAWKLAIDRSESTS